MLRQPYSKTFGMVLLPCETYLGSVELMGIRQALHTLEWVYPVESEWVQDAAPLSKRCGSESHLS